MRAQTLVTTVYDPSQGLKMFLHSCKLYRLQFVRRKAGGDYNYTIEKISRALVLDSSAYNRVTRSVIVFHVSVKLFYFYVSVCLTEAGGSYNYTLEQTLRAQLLDSAVYDPVTRPEDVVHVSVSFHLLSIEKLVSSKTTRHYYPFYCKRNDSFNNSIMQYGITTFFGW